MLRKLRPRSAYDVMAAIAFFIALAGGTAYAASTIGSADIIDESIQSVDINGKDATSTQAGVNGTITGADVAGQPSKPSVGQPGINGSLSTYDIKDKSLVGHSDLAPNSIYSTELKDGSVTKAKLAPSEAVIAVKPVSGPSDCSETRPGGPVTGEFCAETNPSSFWKNNGNGYEPVGFYKDPLGVVHIQGSLEGSGTFDGTYIPYFYLPPGYRPAMARVFLVENDSTSSFADYVTVGANGAVAQSPPTENSAFTSLEGIDFRP